MVRLERKPLLTSTNVAITELLTAIHSPTCKISDSHHGVTVFSNRDLICAYNQILVELSDTIQTGYHPILGAILFVKCSSNLLALHWLSLTWAPEIDDLIASRNSQTPPATSTRTPPAVRSSSSHWVYFSHPQTMVPRVCLGPTKLVRPVTCINHSYTFASINKHH